MVEYTERQLMAMSLTALTVLYNGQTANKVPKFGSKVAAIKAILSRSRLASELTTRKRASKLKRGQGRNGPGIGAFVADCLRRKMGTDEVLDAVWQRFPKASTNARNIAFYRCQLRKANKL